MQQMRWTYGFMKIFTLWRLLTFMSGDAVPCGEIIDKVILENRSMQGVGAGRKFLGIWQEKANSS